MAERVLVVLAGAVALQFVLGILVYVDANRRELDNSGAYWYGASIPVVGYVVLAAYLSHREELPTRDLSPPAATETAGEAVWTIENRGLRRLPRRLAYTIQDGSTLWRAAVTVPPPLAVLAALVDSRVAIALFAFCGVFWLTYLNTARTFTNTTTRLDPADGTITLAWRGGDHPLSPGGDEQEIELSDVQRAEFRRVGSQPLVKLGYERRFSVNLRTLLVSADHLDDLRQMLSAHEIPVRDRIRDGTSRNVVRRRYAEGLLSLVVVPLGAGLVWPQFFFTRPVLLLAGFTVLWLGVKCFAGVFGRVKSLLGAFSS